MGDGRILLKHPRYDSFKKGLSNEPNFGRIYLAGQYLLTVKHIKAANNLSKKFKSGIGPIRFPVINRAPDLANFLPPLILAKTTKTFPQPYPKFLAL